MRQEADLRVGREDLLPAGRERAGQQPRGRGDGHPGEGLALHAEQHHGAQHQRHGGQHLVGDAEQRPQRVDAAQRVDHALVEEVAPGAHAQRGGDQVGRQRIGALERGHEAAQQVLQHEAARARAGVHRGEDEERLEQDGEVVPEGHHGRSAHHLVQDVRHAHGERRRAAGTAQDGVLAHVLRGLHQHVGRDHEAPGGERLRHGLGRGAHERRGAVHREVDAGVDARGGHQRHHGDEGFGQHAAVADVARVGLVLQHLGRGARGDQCVEARHRAAGDGDEEEREQAARPHRAVALRELRDGRHLQRGRHHHDADGQRHDGADLQEGGEVVARCEQQPHRQRGGHETVADQHPGERGARESKHRPPGGVRGHGLPAEDRGHQQHEADDGHLGDAARAQEAQVHAHEKRHGNGRRHGERAPGRFGQRLDHDQRQHGQDDDHDHEGAEERDQPRHGAHLLLDEVAQRAAIAPRGDEEHDEILHRAREHHARQQPQQAGHVAHLRSQHRAHQRPCARDGGEMVAEQHVLVGGHVVQPVVVAPGRRGAPGIQPQHALGDEQAVVAVGDQIDADRRDDDPERADGLAARQRDGAERPGAEHGDAEPHQVAADEGHGTCLLNAGRAPVVRGQASIPARGAARIRPAT